MSLVETRSRRHVDTWREMIDARMIGLHAALDDIDQACPSIDTRPEIAAVLASLAAGIDDQERAYREALARGEAVQIPAHMLNSFR